ncbi:serine hydrolase [uncultured Psychroserpens sp.]|uniref:serine hydrolase domain-containing protein n=1 Tax=uncultured Psychroserpens sp. TaxID=255436 RepID=UPI0026114335|nr:serine hydrolase domain-containing protein [uncultured Psychroserpens sp.]
MKSILKLTVILFLCLSCQAQSETKQNLQKRVTSYLKQLESDQFSGSVLVAHKGEIITSDGYGFANKKANIKNKSNTVFDIGSITKQFTAAGILKLEELGKLSVNDKITKYFKNVPANRDDVTIHHLLTHSSGLPPGIGHDYHIISKDEFIEKALASEMLFKAGTQYEYSNVGYTLLAMIIEQISGESYEDFLYKQLWNPAQMEQTGYIRPKYDKNDVAMGYKDTGEWGKPNEKWNDGISWHLKGNGGILSTVEDMYKWHQALTTNTILSKTSKAKMYTKHIEEGQGAQSHYGYGWAIFPTPRQTELIAHNGGNGIFFADFWRYLNEDIIIIMMSNHANRGYGMLNSNLAGIVLKSDFKPNTKLRQSQADAQSERQIERILDRFLEVIKDDNAKAWETFVKENFSEEMLNLMPMNDHIAMFKKIHNELKEQSVKGVMLTQDDNIEIKFENNSLLITLEKGADAHMKIGGMSLD